MTVKQLTSLSSSFQSIRDLISASLLTTKDSSVSTIQDLVAELQSDECNYQVAWNNLQQLSTLFTLQLQLIDQLKPVFQSSQAFEDDLVNRLDEKRDDGLITSNDVRCRDVSRHQSMMVNAYETLPIPSSKNVQMSDNRLPQENAKSMEDGKQMPLINQLDNSHSFHYIQSAVILPYCLP